MAESKDGMTAFKVVAVSVVILGGIFIVSRASQPIQQYTPPPPQNDALESIVSGAIRGFGNLFQNSSSSNQGMSATPPRPQSSSNNPGPNSGTNSYPPSGGWSFSGGNNINNWQSYQS